jgi:hypothetical protein
VKTLKNNRPRAKASLKKQTPLKALVFCIATESDMAVIQAAFLNTFELREKSLAK